MLCAIFLVFSCITGIAKVKQLTLAAVHVEGSARLPKNFLEKELFLTKGQNLTASMIEDIQLKLYGLGLFKSVLVSLEKTPVRGVVNLNIELEDDPTVLGAWAWGGTLKMTHGEASTQTLTEDQPPLGFSGELVSRNLFCSLHRGQVFIDIDSRGVYRNVSASYGFPRFSREGVQFDANIRVTDVEHRYWDAIGFGSEGSAIWNYDIGYGTFKYGLAILANRPPRFTVPGFPSSLAGPRFSFERETRLHRFLPTPGYRIQPSLLLTPGNYDKSVLRIDGASTHRLADAIITFSGTLQAVGSEGFSSRVSSQIDIPLDQQHDQGAMYLNIRYGHDSMDQQDIWGRSLTLGLRYHSFGFIAEFAVKVTDAPRLDQFDEGGL